MVTHRILASVLAISLAGMNAGAQTTTPKKNKKKAKDAAASTAPVTSSASAEIPAQPRKVIRLSQKDAAELVLKQGDKTKEVNLTYLENRLAPALVLSNYDWKLNINSGYLFNKEQSFSPYMPDSSKYEDFQTDLTLQKTLVSTGTIIGVEGHRLSQKADIPPSGTGSVYPVLPQETQDLYGFTIEQPLLNDFFGLADRATVDSAEITYQAQDVLRANDLQNLALDTIRMFWDTYVAQETFKESLASRDRSQKLLESVRRKTSLGYSLPGDLSQTQAEFETREQGVKSSSVDYLQKMDSLLTTLNLEANSEIEFIVTDVLPPIPKLQAIKADDLRTIRSEKLKVKAANQALEASKSKRWPTLNFVGKIYTSGADASSDSSLSAAASGTHPEYYAGLRLAYNFGSDIQTEDIINKKAAKDLEETRLARISLETNDTLAQAERKVQSTYAIAQSSMKEKEYFDRAVQELNRTYAQGRTDIKTLIDVMNSYFASEVQLSRAIGDYQIALNELAASRDELISDPREENK